VLEVQANRIRVRYLQGISERWTGPLGGKWTEREEEEEEENWEMRRRVEQGRRGKIESAKRVQEINCNFPKGFNVSPLLVSKYLK
jgi:hypothetical protein